MFKEGLLIFLVGMTVTNLFLLLMVCVVRAMEKPLARLARVLPQWSAE